MPEGPGQQIEAFSSLFFLLLKERRFLAPSK